MTDEREIPGMPIYADAYERNLPDPTMPEEIDWYPGTPPTRKLWRCFESLQKMQFLLEGYDYQKHQQRIGRFLINFVVPLDDFFYCVLDLSRSIEGDSQTRSRLSQDERQFVCDQRNRFNDTVIDQSGTVKKARNKLGAHTDKKLEPGYAQRVVQELDIHLIGALLHGSLLALKNLTELDCYAWTSNGYRDDEVRLMNCEPFVISFKSDSKDLVGIEMTESPKRHVHERIADIVELSTWMFRSDQSRLIVNERTSET